MVFLGRSNGEPLIQQSFEAWDLGPVCPQLYRRANRFGDRPVTDVFWDAIRIDDEAMRKAIDDTVDSFGDLTPGQLVSLTHPRGGAWARHYERDVPGIVISNRDILREYRERVDR